MRTLINEISKGKNINENLVKYAKGFMSINNEYAYVRLAMNYFTYYQMLQESEGVEGTETALVLTDINNVIADLMNSDGTDISKSIEIIENARKQIVDKMQALTCYVDMFNIYEYALNRVEYRFRDDELPANYSDEEFTREIMQYILDDEDSVVINSKICSIIGQLPIRMTKGKFFELLNAGLGVYKGGQKQSVNDFVYMIKTSAMLEKPENMTELYPELEKTFEEFREIDFKNIDSDGFFSVKNQLDIVSGYMENVMNANMMAQELINDLLIVLYTVESEEKNKVLTACKEIVKEVNILFTDKGNSLDMESIEDMFVMLEGVQEELYQKLSVYDIVEQITEEYKDAISENSLDKVYEVISRLPKLNADSLFAELDSKPDTEEADEAYVEKIYDVLEKAFVAGFSENQKQVNKAVMSATLAELPVFFNNISELQDYIYNSLEGCSNKAEKLACIEILRSIIEER